ncbi:hypothetical protein Abr02nite_11120 [Paractinoplanes brasiliensis]|nr:hypothetical protein Abr02nite_11120 [Actinoplanes brasiliensis]
MVGPVDVEHGDSFLVQVTRQAGAVAAGAFDADCPDRSVAAHPGRQRLTAGHIGGELLTAEQPPGLVDQRGGVGVSVGVDTTDHLDGLFWHRGACCPSLL